MLEDPWKRLLDYELQWAHVPLQKRLQFRHRGLWYKPKGTTHGLIDLQQGAAAVDAFKNLAEDPRQSYVDSLTLINFS